MKALSYSEMYLFQEERDRWHAHYILGEEEEKDDKMVLGSLIHDKLAGKVADIHAELDKLGYNIGQRGKIQRILDKKAIQQQKRLLLGVKCVRECCLMAELDDIPLIGFADGLDVKWRFLDEDKTVDESGKWHQPRVDSNKQLTFYALLFWLKRHSYFREINLNQMNTAIGTMKTFYTIRSLADIKEVANKIRGVVNEMKSLNLWEKRLTTYERQQLSQKRLDLK